jgi:hyperosmotically inducible protein
MKRKEVLHRAMMAALAAALIGTAGAVRAAEANQPVSPDFSRLDANRDGYLSREETQQLRGFDQAFSEADDNRDGKLDAAEFTKAQSIHDREAAGQYVEDSVITAKVKAALLKDLKTRSFSVSVETRNGTVLLSGFVDDEGQVKRAVEIAGGVQGVVSVKNGLAVKS